jgi:hypothetical protein
VGGEEKERDLGDYYRSILCVCVCVCVCVYENNITHQKLLKNRERREGI